MFGNKSYAGGFGDSDKAKTKGDDKKDQKFKDFSAEDKQDLVQTKNDSVIIHPQTKDLVEKVIRTLKKGL